MDKFSSNFTSSDELGIHEDDPAFMARFENNLNMERRVPRRTRLLTRSSLLKTAAWALAMAALAYWLEPFAAPYLADLSPLVNGNAEYLGLSSAWWTAVGSAILSLSVSLWPQIVDEVEDLGKII